MKEIQAATLAKIRDLLDMDAGVPVAVALFICPMSNVEKVNAALDGGAPSTLEVRPHSSRFSQEILEVMFPGMDMSIVRHTTEEDARADMRRGG